MQAQLNLGTIANDGTGDSLRAAGTKLNANATDAEARIAALEGAPAAGLIGINEQTGTTYTIQASDLAKVVILTNAAPQVVTLPKNKPVGFNGSVGQGGTAQVTLSPESGALMRSASSFTKTRAQYSVLSYFVRTNSDGNSSVYWIVGDGA